MERDPAMIGAGVEAIREELDRHDGLADCLLHELRLVNYGYSIELDFNLVFGVDKGVRPDVLENPEIITFRLDGVTSLDLIGGLAEGMVAHPEAINWGLSEVAGVRVLTTDAGPRLDVAWEAERRITIDFHSASIRRSSP
jgi:hypothetical protein